MQKMKFLTVVIKEVVGIDTTKTTAQNAKIIAQMILGADSVSDAVKQSTVGKAKRK